MMERTILGRCSTKWEEPRPRTVLGTLMGCSTCASMVPAVPGTCRYYVHHCAQQGSTDQALFQLSSASPAHFTAQPFPSSGCSTVAAAGAPRMRYLAPRVAGLAATTSRYCTLLYPRLGRRSPLSTRACRRPVRSRRTSSRRWLCFTSHEFFLRSLPCCLSSSQRSSVLQL